jgi:hypothetical protein
MAVTRNNVSGQDYQGDDTGGSFDFTITKPTATVDGVLQLIFAGINSTAAGSFVLTNFADETVIVEQDSGTTVQAGVMWRYGQTADGATIDGNNTNAASGSKSGLALILSGAHGTTPIRQFASSSGTGTTATCPTTAATGIENGDMIVRGVVFHGDGDTLALTPPGSHTAITPYQPAAAGSKDIGVATAAATASTAPGTADFTIALSRDWVTFTIVVAQAAAGAATTPGNAWERQGAMGVQVCM